MSSLIRRTGLAALVAAGVASALEARQAQFVPLGDLPAGGFSSTAQGVSADGSVVVGLSVSALGAEAFRWTASAGMVGLGDLPGGTFYSNAQGVSDDGSTVVGTGLVATGWRAFRWTAAGGMVDLGYLPPGGVPPYTLYSAGSGVSADGSVVVGFSIGANGYEGFRWTAAGGMVGLGDLPNPWGFDNLAHGVSADGSVVVGRGQSASGYEAYRWTTVGGMVGLGDLPGGTFKSGACGVSADGSIVVGYSNSASGPEAFRWTAAGGMAGLGDLPGGAFDSVAFDVSADGAVVVGRATTNAGEEALLWTSGLGPVHLRDHLVASGTTGLAGWVLTWANAVSDDGTIIVGAGLNPSGQLEAWLVDLSPFYTSMCFGDGSGTSCPCGNVSTQAAGCNHSGGVGGLLSAGGTAGETADDLVLIAEQLLPSQPALLFVGVNAINGGNGVPFGDGLSCAGGRLVRLGVRTPDPNGGAGWGPGLGATGGWAAGDVRYFQVWYRDPTGSPCGAQFNLTNGIGVTFTP